mmetsp:Transcript_7687/g.25474  ORF Transcript_7687/g.25474 Transcript_7687/m.25474 type:complete len:236 (+) Transcript_7687:72-779(+)
MAAPPSLSPVSEWPDPNLPVFSIDVECVANGTTHHSRSVAQISLVDQFERVHLNAFVKQEQEVVSYLTPLTGLTRELLDEHGVPLEQALALLRQALPKHAVLVGQNIRNDVVNWLALREGEDFSSMCDLQGLYRCWNPRYNSWSMFGQDHLVETLLGINLAGQSHNAVFDAIKSIRLYNYRRMQIGDDPAAQMAVAQTLCGSQPKPSFAKLNPEFEGVCMGNKRACKCGAPTFLH